MFMLDYIYNDCTEWCSSQWWVHHHHHNHHHYELLFILKRYGKIKFIKISQELKLSFVTLRLRILKWEFIYLNEPTRMNSIKWWVNPTLVYHHHSGIVIIPFDSYLYKNALVEMYVTYREHKYKLAFSQMMVLLVLLLLLFQDLFYLL